jgi:hypothetical protein
MPPGSLVPGVFAADRSKLGATLASSGLAKPSHFFAFMTLCFQLAQPAKIASQTDLRLGCFIFIRGHGFCEHTSGGSLFSTKREYSGGEYGGQKFVLKRKALLQNLGN